MASTIAQLIMEQGRQAAESRTELAKIAANALTSNASAAAEAARQKGAIWGGAINQIGQSIAAIPGNIQHQKSLDLQQQDIQAQIAERQSLAQERQAKVAQEQRAESDAKLFDTAISSATDPETGLIDVKSMVGKVPAQLLEKNIPIIDTHNKALTAFNDAKDTALSSQFLRAYISGDPNTLASAGQSGAGIGLMKPEDAANLQQIADAIKSGPQAAQKPSTQAISVHVGGRLKAFQPMLQKWLDEQGKQEHMAAETRHLNAESNRPQLPTEASLAAEANPGNPAGAVSMLQGGKAKPSMDEQLLEAITKGDTAGAARITQTLKAAADARKDPAAAAAAREMGSLRVEEAQARLEAMREKAQPLDISADVRTTASGKQYIDGSQYQGQERNKARAAAGTAGVTMVSKEQADALQEIDNARSNQKSIISQIGDILPKDPTGRIVSAPGTLLSRVFQTDAQKAAFGTWRTAAVQSMRAVAGSKGVRMSQKVIDMAVENDIPKLTDTYAVAQQKVRNMQTLLDNAESAIVVKDRTENVPDATVPPPSAITPANRGLLSRP